MLSASNHGYQWHQQGMVIIKKGVFFFKCIIQKLWCHLHSVTAFASLYAVMFFTKANSKLSSTRNTSQCKRQQATFSFKPVVFLQFSYMYI